MEQKGLKSRVQYQIVQKTETVDVLISIITVNCLHNDELYIQYYIFK